MVYISEKLRPFVVTAINIPADTVDTSLPPYRATVAIFYDNSDIEVEDPCPVVEHTNHWAQPAAKGPSQDAITRIHFVFDNVKVDYVGEYTMTVSVFRPGDDLEGPAYLKTTWSTMTRVAALSQPIQPTPPSKCFFPRSGRLFSDWELQTAWMNLSTRSWASISTPTTADVRTTR
jgi:hypothetical protein